MFRGVQNPDESLAVMVSGKAPHACGRKSIKLVGVANWASLCTLSRPHRRRIESVIGQARNTYFTVSLSFKQKKNWRDRDVDVEQIAGMVAGNLY